MDEQQSGGGQFTAGATGFPPFAWHQLPPLAPSSAHAGFRWRFLASLIDGVLVAFALCQLNLVPSLILERVIEVWDAEDDLWRALAASLGGHMMLVLVLNWLYFAVMESSSWQATLGKRALGMVVTDLTGNRISFGRAASRLLACCISGIPLWLGYLVQPFTAKRQAMHDIIAGTLVVRT